MARSKAGQQGCGILLFFAAVSCAGAAMYSIARAHTREANSVRTNAIIVFDTGGAYIYEFSVHERRVRGTLITHDPNLHFKKDDLIPVVYNALDPAHNNYGTTLESRSPGESPKVWFFVAGFFAFLSFVKFGAARNAPLDFPS